MASGFNFFTTSSNKTLRAKLLSGGSYAKDVIFGSVKTQMNALNNRGYLAVYLDATVASIDDYIAINGKKFSVSKDGVGFILNITDNLETDSSTDNLNKKYLSGNAVSLTKTGVLLVDQIVTVPTSYGYTQIGTKKLKYAVINNRKVLVVRK